MKINSGDSVIYCNIHHAKIISKLPSGDIRIEFNDINLIPNKMNVPINTLELLLEDGKRIALTNTDENCPKCYNVWNKIEGFRDFYYHCLKCDIKREDVL